MEIEDIRSAIGAGRTALGIELGSTRIKAVPDRPGPRPARDRQPRLGEPVRRPRSGPTPWTPCWSGLQEAYAVAGRRRPRRGTACGRRTFGAIGVSAMMHGYLAFDASGELLVPFRTWRNTTTGAAAARS